MDSLPYEIVLEMFNFLEIYEILKIISTSKEWVDIIGMDYFWKKRMVFDFGIVQYEGTESHRERYMRIFEAVTTYYERNRKKRGLAKKRQFKWKYFDVLIKYGVQKAINPASRMVISHGRFDFFSIDPNEKYNTFINELIEYLVSKPSTFGFYFYDIKNLKKFALSAYERQPEVVLPRILKNVKYRTYMLDTCRFKQNKFSFLFEMDETLLPFFIDQLITSKSDLQDFYHTFRPLNEDLKKHVTDHNQYLKLCDRIFFYLIDIENKKYFENGFVMNLCFLDPPNDLLIKLFKHLVKHQKLFRKCLNGVSFVDIIEQYIPLIKQSQENQEEESVVFDKFRIFEIITKSRVYLEQLIITSTTQKRYGTISVSEERLQFTEKLLILFDANFSKEEEDGEETEEEKKGKSERRKVFVNTLFEAKKNPSVVKSRVTDLFLPNSISFRRIFSVIPDLKPVISKYFLQTDSQHEYIKYYPRFRDIMNILDEFPNLLREDVMNHLIYRFNNNNNKNENEDNGGITSLISSIRDLVQLQEKLGSQFAEEEVVRKLVRKQPLDFVKVVKNYFSLVTVFQKFPDFQNEIYLAILKKKKYEQKISRRGIKIFRKNYRKEFARLRN